MDAAEAASIMRAAAAAFGGEGGDDNEAAKLEFSQHAQERMEQRGVAHADVVEALARATAARLRPGDAVDDWVVPGRIAAEQKDFEAVIAIEDGVIVVTVIVPEKRRGRRGR